MKIRLLAALGLACSLAFSSLAVLAEDAAPKPSLSNKWRIKLDGTARSAGTITFRVTPDQGEPVEIAVPIKDGRGENGVATDIKDAMKKTLDAKTYHVETDDGEDVLVKKKKGPNFEVALVESSVQNTRIVIRKE